MNYYFGLCFNFRHLRALWNPSDRIYGHFVLAFGHILRLLEMYFLGYIGLETLEKQIFSTPNYHILVYIPLSFNLSHHLRNSTHF